MRRRPHFDNWMTVQGARIKAARPDPVYLACVRLASDRARHGGPVKLSADDIEECAGRALSNERVRRFGRLPASAEEWGRQIASITEAWRAPQPTA